MIAPIQYSQSNDHQEIPTPVITILERGVITFAAGSPAMRKLADRVIEAGWTADLGFSRTHTTDEFYAADSIKKPGEEAPAHRRGDLKIPAHDTSHWWLSAAYVPLRLGFTAHWTEGVTPKGARSFKFEEVECRDPIGEPREAFYDYSPDANALRREKFEPEWAHKARVERLLQNAQYLDRTYNLGEMWLNHKPIFRKAGEFETWLQEALKMTEMAQANERKKAA